MSSARQCLAFSGLFEAELLLELMLRFWEHPLATDEAFRNELLEGAASVLRSSIAGEKLVDELPPGQMNFVAAAWYVEWNAIRSSAGDPDGRRRAWLDRLRRAIPSCFCTPESLP